MRRRSRSFSAATRPTAADSTARNCCLLASTSSRTCDRSSRRRQPSTASRSSATSTSSSTNSEPRRTGPPPSTSTATSSCSSVACYSEMCAHMSSCNAADSPKRCGALRITSLARAFAGSLFCPAISFFLSHCFYSLPACALTAFLIPYTSLLQSSQSVFLLKLPWCSCVRNASPSSSHAPPASQRKFTIEDFDANVWNDAFRGMRET